MHANVSELGEGAADILLDLACQRVRVGQGALRVEAEREERDEPVLGLEEADFTRRRSGARFDEPSDPLCVGLDVRPCRRAPGGGLAERLEMRLDGGHLRDGLCDCPFDLGRDVGGPSAGLAFALEVLEQRGRDVDHGLKIAATGEIQLDGSVTSIGGVKQKTIGARQAHVDAFLVPVDGDNAKVAKRYAHGLRIIPVKNFQQALQALATLPRNS